MNIQNIVNQGIQKLNNKQYFDALNIFTQLTKLLPNEALSWHLLAVTEKNLGKLEYSEKHLKKALELSPFQPEIINTYANLLSELNKLAQAKMLFKKAIKHTPNYINSYINLANMLLKNKEFNLAIKYYNDAICIDKNSFSALLGVALCYMEIKNFTKSEAILLELLRNHPNNERVLHNLGLVYKNINKTDKAISFFTHAINTSNNSTISRMNLASCFLLQGEYDLAIKEYQIIINSDPLNKEAHSKLTSIKWAQSKNQEECFSNYIQAINLTNSSSLIAEYLKKLLYSKSYNSVIKLCDELMEKKITNSDILASKSQALRELGYFEEAIDVCNYALKKDNSSLALKYEYGHALLADGNGEKALKIFNQLCQLAPNNLSNFTLKSTSLKLLGKHSEYNKICDVNKFISVKEIEIPQGFSSLAEFNQQLSNDLNSLHNTKRSPLEQSLINGTQTIGDLFPSTTPSIALLELAIKKEINRYISQLTYEKSHPLLGQNLNKGFKFNGSWSVMLQQQGFHKSHYHSDGWISLPYYVALPEAINKTGEGWIEFGVPEFKMRHQLEADVILKPQAGCLVLFPSYMWHGTRPFTTNEQRLTVACDVIPE